MNSQVRIGRSRGAVSGAALVLLGLWGGLAPFVGPYFHFGYTPDTAWSWTTGRLYYSVIPGAVALVAGALLIITRSRLLGVTAGVLAALAGGWFVLGSGVTYYLLKVTTIATGSPIGAAGTGGVLTVKEYLEELALYGALGAVIIFCGALACGRLSMISAQDASDGYYPATSTPPGDLSSAASSYPTTGQFPAVGQYPDPDTGSFPPAGEFPSAAGQFPTASDQFTRPSVFPPRRPPFRDSPTELGPDAPADN